MRRKDPWAEVSEAVRERWMEAIMLSRDEQDAAVIEVLREAIHLDPDCIESYVRLAGAYCETDRWEEAIEACREGLRIHPESALLYNHMAGIYGEYDRPEEEIAAYREASRLDPENDFYRSQIALIFEELGRTEQAFSAYCELLHRMPPDAGSGSLYDGPKWATAAAVLAVLLRNTGLLEETLERLRERIRSHPQPESLLPA